MIRFSTSTPMRRAKPTSRACSASTKAAVPPARWASRMTCREDHRLAGPFRAVDLDDPPPSGSRRCPGPRRWPGSPRGWHRPRRCRTLLPHAHDGALAVLLLDLRDGQVQGLVALTVRCGALGHVSIPRVSGAPGQRPAGPQQQLAQEAGRDVVEDDPPSSGQALQLARRRRLEDVESPEHQKAGDGGHRAVGKKGDREEVPPRPRRSPPGPGPPGSGPWPRRRRWPRPGPWSRPAGRSRRRWSGSRTGSGKLPRPPPYPRCRGRSATGRRTGPWRPRCAADRPGAGRCRPGTRCQVRRK